MKQNAFDSKRIAEGYKNRPYLHKQVIEQFHNEMNSKCFRNGLDIGCGAGLSTKALKLICDHVVGADISPEMISVAKEVCVKQDGFDFIVSRAEEIPAFQDKFDIVTAAGVIQWVDKDTFLNHLFPIMTEEACILIYDFGITDQMLGNDVYTHWWHSEYLKEFPKPFRNEAVWTEQDVEKYGFTMVKQIPIEMVYEFDLESFIHFMMIQTNVNDKIEGEGRNTDDVYQWFHHTLSPVLRNQAWKLVFKGYSWYLIKTL